MNRQLIVIPMFLLASAAAMGGQFNQKLDIGDAAPAWKQLPGVDGQKHSLGDLSDQKVVVVVFTCNSCPYAVDSENRLIALQRQYADRGVAVVAINVNKVEEDLLPAMKEKASERGFDFPYLFDETQQIAREFGAIYTPEFYVLDSERRVVYMGAMDDSPDGRAVTKRYVQAAIDAALSGEEPEISETPPIGCRVRYERVRRTRRKAVDSGQ